MAFTYGFYNSLKGDRKYNAEQMSEIFDGILKDGIIPSVGQLFAVKTANNGMQITVGTGRAWFNHTWSKNDSVMVLALPYSDISRDRYDAIVLEVNRNDDIRANSIKIVSGVPDVNPTKPTLVNTDKVHQYPLAYIFVEGGSDAVEARNIENMVGRSPTVFATGVLETVSLDVLWSQWEGEWDEWFEDIKVQLSGNVATNLQLQIDQLRNEIPDRASNSETINGTNSTKYTTPAGVKAAIDSHKDEVKDQSGAVLNVRTANTIPIKDTVDGISTFNFLLKDYYFYYAVRTNTDLEIARLVILVVDRSTHAVRYDSYPLDYRSTSTSDSVGYDRGAPIEGTNQALLYVSRSLLKITVSSSTISKVTLMSLPLSVNVISSYLFQINATYSALMIRDKNSTNQIQVYKIINSSNSTPTLYAWSTPLESISLSDFGVSANGIVHAYISSGVLYAELLNISSLSTSRVGSDSSIPSSYRNFHVLSQAYDAVNDCTVFLGSVRDDTVGQQFFPFIIKVDRNSALLRGLSALYTDTSREFFIDLGHHVIWGLDKRRLNMTSTDGFDFRNSHEILISRVSYITYSLSELLIPIGISPYPVGNDAQTTSVTCNNAGSGYVISSIYKFREKEEIVNDYISYDGRKILRLEGNLNFNDAFMPLDSGEDFISYGVYKMTIYDPNSRPIIGVY